jgi:YVTN family beta-propeller protein
MPEALRTFLIVDVRGYTAYTQEFGDAAAADLAMRFADLVAAVVEEHDGATVELRGDEALVAFFSARAAIQAALALQEAAGQVDLAGGIGIGMDAGEAVAVSDGFRGGALNRAARLCARAKAGEILVTDTVVRLAGPTADAAWDDLGTVRVKGVEQPIRVFGVRRPAAARRKRPRRHGVWIAAGGIALVAAAGAGFLYARSTSGGQPSVAAIAPDSLAIFDARRHSLVSTAAVGSGPGAVAVGEGGIWVADESADALVRVDPITGAASDRIPVGGGPDGVAVGGGFVWVTNGLDGTVSKVDPTSGKVVQRIDVGNRPRGVAFAAGSVWVANAGDRTVQRLSAATGEQQGAVDVPDGADELAAGQGRVWVTAMDAGTVTGIDARTATTLFSSISVGGAPTALAVAPSGVWVANGNEGTLVRIDPSSGQVRGASVFVGERPVGIAVAGDSVWVSNEVSGDLALVSPPYARVTRRIPAGNPLEGVAVTGSRLVVAVRPSVRFHRGGTLTLLGHEDLEIDPGLAGDPIQAALLADVYDGLVTYARVGGVDGFSVVPDLADTVPRPTDGGRTYVFHLRPGIRYSNGALVEPADVRHSIERALMVEAQVNDQFAARGGDYFATIAGTASCSADACDLSRSIVADPATRTVTFHLTQPDPDFLQKLALPVASVLPMSAPTEPIAVPVAGTGPYSAVLAGGVPKLVRNRRFHVWSQIAQPDGYPDTIVYRPGTDEADTAPSRIESGRGDWVRIDGAPASLVADLETNHGSLVRENPEFATLLFLFNTRVRPFDDVLARRAVEYAVDRQALADRAGGPARPVCQFLLRGLPGYRPYCPYTAPHGPAGHWTAPDLTKAKQLVRRSGTLGARVRVRTYDAPLGWAREMVATLRRIGYDARVDLLSADQFVAGDHASDEMLTSANYADFPSTSAVLGSYACNRPLYCDPSIVSLLDRADQQADGNAAAALQAEAERRLVDAAPAVAFATRSAFDLVSVRVGNYQYNPQYGALLDQLWVR